MAATSAAARCSSVFKKSRHATFWSFPVLFWTIDPINFFKALRKLLLTWCVGCGVYFLVPICINNIALPNFVVSGLVLVRNDALVGGVVFFVSLFFLLGSRISYSVEMCVSLLVQKSAENILNCTLTKLFYQFHSNSFGQQFSGQCF